MIKTLLLITSLAFSMTASAAVDIYGTSNRNVQNILKKHNKEIAELEAKIKEAIQSAPAGDNDDRPEPPLVSDIKKRQRALIDELKKENGFLFVDMQVVFFPDTQEVHSTVEVVDKEHPERLRFLAPKRSHDGPGKRKTHTPDLIDTMIKYDNITFDMMRLNQLKSVPPCPVYHCAFDFENPKLKPYLAIFNKGAIKEKTFILDTLQHDPDPERRAAAAFLVGHFQDPHQILSVLLPQVTDKDDGVRNNVMRVIGTTMEKAKIHDIDVNPFLEAIDSPYDTDRNKALVVLLNAAESKSIQKQIIQKGGNNLLALLRLEQPNNHDWAYLILKKISGKDFGSTNVTAWSKWVAAAKNKVS